MITTILAAVIFPGQILTGYLGMVVPQRAEIKIGRRQTFTGRFEVVPGQWAPIAGDFRHDTFTVNGWFSAPAVVTDDRIIGDGVDLWSGTD